MRRCVVSGSVLLGLWLGFGALACGEPEEGLAPPGVGPEVERDGWVDQARLVSGDGRHDFISDAALSFTFNYTTFGSPQAQALCAAPTAAEGARLYMLSGHAGLVVVDASDPAAPRAEGRIPVNGLPFAVSVQDGIVLALVNQPLPGCGPAGCSQAARSRAVLIDARDASQPRELAERELPGVITHSYRKGSALYVVSRSLEPCYECAVIPERSAAVTGFDLTDPLTLGDLGQLELPAHEFGQRSYQFGEGRLFVAAPGESLRAIELDGAPRLGASAPDSAEQLWSGPLSVEAGVVRASAYDGNGQRRDLEYQVSATGELTPIDPVRFTGPNGELVQPVFDGAVAYAVGGDGLSLSVYDLSDRRAPRSVGSVALPNAVSDVVAVSPGRVLAFGSGVPAESFAPLHLTLIDVREPGAPVVLSDVSGPRAGFRSSDRPRFDAASGVLLMPYRLPSLDGLGPLWLQLVDTVGDTLALGAAVPVVAEAFFDVTQQVRDPAPLAGFLITGDRLVEARYDRLYTYPVRVNASRSQLVVSVAAGAVRVAGNRVVRFQGDALSPQLLPGDSTDLLTTPGTNVGDLLDLGFSGRWNQPVYTSGAQLFMTRSGGDASTLGVYRLDMSDPSAPIATGSVSLAASSGSFFDALQTSKSLAVPRGRGGSVAFGEIARDGRYPAAALSYDIVDLSDPAAPRLASSWDVPPDLAEAGFQRGVLNTTLDTPSGWQSLVGTSIAAGDLLVTQHSEPSADGRLRYYLDRLDLSDPSQPRLLPPVNIPGSVIAFDAATSSLITLETLIVDARLETSVECETRGYASSYSNSGKGRCRVWRRALNGLTLDGDTATLQSRLLLDEDRRALFFAVSGDQVFYVTEPPGTGYSATLGSEPPSSGGSLERVRLIGGQLERLPSIDISALHPGPVRGWYNVVARGNRVYSLSGHYGELGVVDLASDPPTLSRYPLPPWGCPTFDVIGDTAYCARGDAGLQVIDLTAAP